MSRGISRQQQRILGLAVAISRYRNGEPVARVPQPAGRYPIPTVRGRWPDVWTAIAAHILGGVALCRSTGSGSKVFLETTQPARTTRSITARAIRSLLEWELLAYRPRHGYCLTTSGLAAGLPHELPVADLGRRLWLMEGDGTADKHPEWQMRWNEATLPSPALSD